MSEFISLLANERVLVLDGAMGTMIQQYQLSEEDFRGDRFAGHSKSLKGNYDIRCLTRPEIIGRFISNTLKQVLIIETNTFNANEISQAAYGTQDLVYEYSTGKQQKLRRNVPLNIRLLIL